jgi:hypothetical protein
MRQLHPRAQRHLHEVRDLRRDVGMFMTLPAALAANGCADPVRIAGFPPAAKGAVSLDACFGLFLRRVVPAPAAYAEARLIGRDVAVALRAALDPKADLDIVDHVICGSVGKRTAIAPIAMVDVLYAVPRRFVTPRAADALKIVQAVLHDRFGAANLAEDQSGVIVLRGAVAVKVWPARLHESGFLMPGPATLDRASGWSVTNPIAEAATLRLSDSLYGGRPRLLLAALKAWRRHADASIAPFGLELLVQEFYASGPRAYALDRALTEFWGWIRSRAGTGVRPPGGRSALDLGEAWRGKAKAAYWRATLAEHHLKENRLVDAAVEWRQALGPPFPVPGEQPLKALPLFRKAKAEAAR